MADEVGGFLEDGKLFPPLHELVHIFDGKLARQPSGAWPAQTEHRQAAAKTLPGDYLEAQRARLRATSQRRNSQILSVARLIPRPFCASLSEDGPTSPRGADRAICCRFRSPAPEGSRLPLEARDPRRRERTRRVHVRSGRVPRFASDAGDSRVTRNDIVSPGVLQVTGVQSAAIESF